MQPTSTNVPERQAWYISVQTTIAGRGDVRNTPDDAFDQGIVGLLDRLARRAAPGQTLTVLVDEQVADILRLRLVVDDPDEHPVRRDAAAAGWKSTKVQFWTTFYAEDRPTVCIGQLDELENRAQRDPLRWPFGRFVEDIVARLQLWAELTGVAWQAEPAVMGIELLHATLPAYRVPGVKGNKRPAKRDERTPDDAGEPVWTPAMWSRGWRAVADELGAAPGQTVHVHWYDKVKAGLVAAGQTKVSPEPLQHRHRPRWDTGRAGWWLISKPPWNEPRLPHPAGPAGEVWERVWVTTPTMDLLAQLAEQGRLDMPEPIEAYTGLARESLKPWYRTLWGAYSAPFSDRYAEGDQTAIRSAVAETATRGIGMLNHSASTIYRPDWYYSINGMKRANAWRVYDEIATTEDLWPVMIEDDAVAYASLDPDPRTAAPKVFSAPTRAGRPRTLDGSEPGDYRVEDAKTLVRVVR